MNSLGECQRLHNVESQIEELKKQIAESESQILEKKIELEKETNEFKQLSHLETDSSNQNLVIELNVNHVYI